MSSYCIDGCFYCYLGRSVHFQLVIDGYSNEKCNRKIAFYLHKYETDNTMNTKVSFLASGLYNFVVQNYKK